MATAAVSDHAHGRDSRSSGVRRLGLFLLGSILNLLGLGAWLLSALLMAPLLLAGLWVWSHEFAWAKKLLRRFGRWAESYWRRVRASPVKWGLTTAVSLGATTAAYWYLMA